MAYEKLHVIITWRDSYYSATLPMSDGPYISLDHSLNKTALVQAITTSVVTADAVISSLTLVNRQLNKHEQRERSSSSG